MVSVGSFLLVLEGLWSLFSEKPFFVWLNAQFAPFGDWLWINLYKWIAVPFGMVGFVVLVLILWSLWSLRSGEGTIEQAQKSKPTSVREINALDYRCWEEKRRISVGDYYETECFRRRIRVEAKAIVKVKKQRKFGG